MKNKLMVFVSILFIVGSLTASESSEIKDKIFTGTQYALFSGYSYFAGSLCQHQYHETDPTISCLAATACFAGFVVNGIMHRRSKDNEKDRSQDLIVDQ